jgi:ankyrin repeat protein
MRDEAALRQWVEANPGRVNEMLKDRSWADAGRTVLFAAVFYLKSLPLTVWYLNEKGADVNAICTYESTPLLWQARWRSSLS